MINQMLFFKKLHNFHYSSKCAKHYKLIWSAIMRVARSEIGNCTSDLATCVVAPLIMSITLDGIREKISPFRRGGEE